VKILRRGQKSTDGHQLNLGELGALGEDFCSLGQSLDYYQRLAELSEALRHEILEYLRDCILHPELAEQFADEEGWRTSIMRFIDWESFQRDASVLLQLRVPIRVEMGMTLRFQVTGWQDPLDLYFHASVAQPAGLPAKVRLPGRIAVLTGRNGSGKSTLLARLARVLHASQRDRESDQLMRLGTLIPEGIGFTRILSIAYSAFDTFQVPGVDARERRQIAEDLKRGGGRYYFCGLRDIVRELEEGLDTIEDSPTRPTSRSIRRSRRATG